MLAGCNYRYQAYPGTHRPDHEIALVNTLSGIPRVQLERVDAAGFNEAPKVEMLPGTHVVDAQVNWSNGYSQKISLTFDAKAGVEYGLSALEHAPPELAEDPLDLTEPVKEQVLLWTWPIWGPPMAWHNWTAPTPTSPPKDHSMEVWIMSGPTAAAHWTSQ
jgi:hypothetical protein